MFPSPHPGQAVYSVAGVLKGEGGRTGICKRDGGGGGGGEDRDM